MKTLKKDANAVILEHCMDRKMTVTSTSYSKRTSDVKGIVTV